MIARTRRLIDWVFGNTPPAPAVPPKTSPTAAYQPAIGRRRTPESMVQTVSGQFRDARALYRATRQTRFTKRTNQVGSTGLNEDYHYSSECDYFRLVELARDLDRNDMIVGQGISRLINNIVQGGFVLDPKTGNPGADELIKYVWETWSTDRDSCDYEREKSFADLERILLRHVIVDGDTLVLPIRDGSLQVIEGHRLRTPHDLDGDIRNFTIHGVQLDAGRRRVAYHVTDDDIGYQMASYRAHSRAIPARNANGRRLVHHLYYPRRMTQTRGVSRLAPVIDPASIHDDVQFATLVSRQVQACFTLIRERPLGFTPAAGAEDDWRYEPDPCQPGETRPLQNLSAGMMYTGYPGELVKGFTPTLPGATHFDHAMQVMAIIAVNLDLPMILFMLDSSETNFSGWRGSMDQAKVAFQMFQRWFASIFHREIFLWKMRQWSFDQSPNANPIIVRLVQRGVNVFRHEWVMPTWPYIEPFNDAQADLLELRNGLTSPRRIMAKRGLDWDIVSSEIVEDRLKLITKGIEAEDQLRRQFSDRDEVPTWERLAPVPLPDGLQASIAEDAPDVETVDAIPAE